jgi:hypothetical protein
MPTYYLTLHLHSDATFGRGEGLAGLVDVEIEHDEYGCPFIGGRALKGLLVEEWANLRFALGETDAWDAEATTLFGGSGATHGSMARMHVGAATLPPDLHAAIRHDSSTTSAQVLAALTEVRRQTSIDAATGAPELTSLRAIRVLLRGTPLIARLDMDDNFMLSDRALGLLAACTLAVRRGGTGRNRGRGRLSLLLHDHVPADYHDATFTRACFAYFEKAVQL